MCLLVAQTMANELLLGGGGRENYLSRPTFLRLLLKAARWWLVALLLFDGIVYVFFPLLQ